MPFPALANGEWDESPRFKIGAKRKMIPSEQKIRVIKRVIK